MSSVSIGSEGAFVAHLANSDKPKHVVYFTAAWCGPCQMVAPQIEELSEKYAAEADILNCLLYTSDAADEEDSGDLGGRRLFRKKKKTISLSCTVNCIQMYEQSCKLTIDK
eukprot:TRINITY_DN23845_c0_g1_i2.p2 TRINITY_DN23845_c0_g1~~TRINITY_DN23845_c0_g1_i2.p2  ORF type:complete len:111 (-),score=23.34 TRINITY_DN23845_c0_g1_i2:26-358(-)